MTSQATEGDILILKIQKLYISGIAEFYWVD